MIHFFLPVVGQSSALRGVAEVSQAAALTWGLVGAGASKMAALPRAQSSPQGLSSLVIWPEHLCGPAAGF